MLPTIKRASCFVLILSLLSLHPQLLGLYLETMAIVKQLFHLSS